jgi:hypothetical protein
VIQPIGKKAIFAVPIERETEGFGIGESALKEWKDVANTQGKISYEIRKRTRSGQTKKKKEIK